MAFKKFDKKLHEEFDKQGKRVVKNFLVKLGEGYEVKENKDRYGVDLVIYKNGEKIAYAEVEVRASWSGPDFPYEDLNIPYRKKKLLINDKKTEFYSINKELTHMFRCTARTILESKVAIISNKYAKNEPFFKVKLEDLEKIVL